MDGRYSSQWAVEKYLGQYKQSASSKKQSCFSNLFARDRPCTCTEGRDLGYSNKLLLKMACSKSQKLAETGSTDSESSTTLFML